jgi:hypothetical protein
VPLPLVDVLADMKKSFFGLCLTAGQQVFRAMMEQDREHLCGPKNLPGRSRDKPGNGDVTLEVGPSPPTLARSPQLARGIQCPIRSRPALVDPAHLRHGDTEALRPGL